MIDEKGDAKLVIMSVEDYQKLLVGKLQKQVEDVDRINQEIIRAQLKEGDELSGKPKPFPSESRRNIPPYKSASERRMIPRTDLREEVIDPSFDFEGPKVEEDDL